MERNRKPVYEGRKGQWRFHSNPDNFGLYPGRCKHTLYVSSKYDTGHIRSTKHTNDSMVGSRAEVIRQSNSQDAGAGGVLPIARDPQGQTWILLGRENSHRRGVIHAGTWCDFGGVFAKNKCPTTSAAREFVEETLGCALGHMSTHETKMYIQNHECLCVRSMYGRVVPYDMHIVAIDYDPDIPAKFTRCLGEITQKTSNFFPKFVFDQHGRPKSAFLEKDALRWISLDELSFIVHSVTHFRRFEPWYLRWEFRQTLRQEWHKLLEVFQQTHFFT